MYNKTPSKQSANTLHSGNILPYNRCKIKNASNGPNRFGFHEDVSSKWDKQKHKHDRVSKRNNCFLYTDFAVSGLRKNCGTHKILYETTLFSQTLLTSLKNIYQRKLTFIAETCTFY